MDKHSLYSEDVRDLACVLTASPTKTCESVTKKGG